MSDGPAPVRLLLVRGSLQRASMNGAVLDVVRAVAATLTPPVEVHEYASIGELPAFNPDDDADDGDDAGRVAPPPVSEWRAALAASDAVVIGAPEYAGSLPGALKNALDWIVGSAELYRKPVALLSAGTSGGVHSRHHLTQTLTWQGAHVVASCGVAAPRTKVDASGALADADTLAAIAAVVRTAVAAPRLPDDERLALVHDVVAAAGVDTAHIAPMP